MLQSNFKNKTMDIIELILDEEMDNAGVEALSIVSDPAIMEQFIALNSQEKKYKFAEIDKERQILCGPALIPDKMIYRRDGDREYYVHFSASTVRRASELFFIKSNQNNATLEHESPLEKMTIVESWIIENPEMDKSKMYGMNLPKGTWMISMKVQDKEIWDEQVKSGLVSGFSIEGFFAQKAIPAKKEEHSAEAIAVDKINKLKELLTPKK